MLFHAMINNYHSQQRDQSHAAYAKWEHMDISLDVDKTVERLRKHRDL
jgi:hypothetical protein